MMDNYFKEINNTADEKIINDKYNIIFKYILMDAFENMLKSIIIMDSKNNILKKPKLNIKMK